MKKLGRARRAPLAIACVGALIALAAAVNQRHRNEAAIEARFSIAAERIASALVERVRLYQYGLRGARGAIVAAGEVATGAGFARYCESRSLAEEFPGALGYGFVRNVAAGDIDAFVAAAAEEAPGFAVRELGPHDGDHFIIQYIHPLPMNAAAVGLDIGSEPRRRAAAIAAAEKGDATLTAPISLVQLQGDDQQGFLLLLPVRKGGALLGWTYAPLSVSRMLGDLDLHAGELTISVSDITESADSQPFFASTNERAPTGGLPHVRLTQAVFGRTWLIELAATPALVLSMRQTSPLSVSVAIIFFSLLLALTVRLYLASLARQIRSEQRFRDLAESLPQLIWTCLPDGTIDYLSPQWCTYTGASEVTLRATRVLDCVHPDGREQIRDVWQRALAAGSAFDADVQLRRHDGAYRWFKTRALPVADDAGQIIRWFGSNIDIQDLRDAKDEVDAANRDLEARVVERTRALGQATDALRETLAIQRTVLASAGSAIIGTDPSGLITLFNPAAEALLGYSANDLVGHATPALFHDPDELSLRRDVLEKEHAATIASDFDVLVNKARQGVSDANQWIYVRQDGRRVPVLLTVTSIKDDLGAVSGYLGVAVDLTAQKQQETQLRALNELLVDRSALAESANAAKTMFLANMSHEIRTPIAAITGTTYLLSRTDLTSEQRTLTATIDDSSKLLLAMINDVLDVSKIEAQQLVLERQELSPKVLVEELGSIMRGYAAGKDLEVCLRVDPGLPESLMGDRVRLMQILVNLMGNAIKFTPRGLVELTVRTLSHEGGAARLRFEVRDSGPGIAREQISKLFTPFKQLQRAHSRAGTGLGLALSKELVRLMGGTIGVESELGRGSTFWFEVPFELTSHVPRGGAPSVDHSDGVAGRRILVVDDSMINRDIAARILTLGGANVCTAQDGDEAIAKLRDSGPVDCVLMDLEMPGVGGIESIQVLRAEPAFSRIPIIAVTAHAITSERDRAFAAGADDFVTKPFDPHDLMARVAQCVGGAMQLEAPVVPLSPKSPAPGEWPMLAGFDSTEACERFNDDLAMFLRFLGVLDSELADLEEMLSAHRDGSHPELIDRIHRVGGIAGNLAARGVHQTASALEVALRSLKLIDTTELVQDMLAEVRIVRATCGTVAHQEAMATSGR